MNRNPTTTVLIVEPPEEGTRLDVFLAATTRLSRRAARRLVADGAVLRNSAPTRQLSRTMIAGDVIEILVANDELDPRQPHHIQPPETLHDDRWVLVANKPAGVLSQPAESGRSTELSLDQILLLHIAAREGRRPYLRLVHRLDRLTSGAVLFGRNPQALPPITAAWSNGRVDRRYLAVVEGHPMFEVDDIDMPIGRDPDHTWKFRVGAGGREAHSVVRVLDRGSEGVAVVECRLLTGRTHQVRVHLAAIGHPVVADRLYGCREPSLAQRPLLHAAVLAFPHPKTGDWLEVVCPLPEDLKPFVSDQVAARLGQPDDTKTGE